MINWNKSNFPDIKNLNNPDKILKNAKHGDFI